MNQIKNINEIFTEFRDYITFDNNNPTGEFKDLAKDAIDKHLPKYTDEQVKQHLLKAQDIVLKAGVTHIRDLTCSEQQFEQALNLQATGELKIVADLFFKLTNFTQLNNHIKMITKLKEKQTPWLKIKGVKVFIDGALGSEGALLSEPYLSGKNGFKLFSDAEIKTIFEKCKENSLEVAFHTIGDQSALDVLRVLGSIDGNVTCHIEHAQLLCDEAIALIQKNKVICHMQPQHWFSDKEWLHQKISQKLLNRQFRWADLEALGTQIYFGSDAPVEHMNVGDVVKCLNNSEESGIKPIIKDVKKYLTYPDTSPIQTKTFLSKDLKVTKIEY